MFRNGMRVDANVLRTEEARAEPVSGGALYAQSECIDGVGTEQVRVTEGVTLIQVVVTRGGRRQEVAAGQAVRRWQIKRRKDVAAENGMFRIDLIVDFVDQLPLVDLLNGSPVERSAGIGRSGKHLRDFQSGLVEQ